MKKLAILLSVTPLVWSCATTDYGAVQQPENPTASVRIERITPYSDDAKVANDIRNECDNQRKLSHFIQVYGAEHNIAIERVNDLVTDAEGKVLEVAITDAISRGNAFIGHRKYTDIEGTLYEDGAEQASFTATRVSGGGAFGGFKGSCSVLGRTVEVLGKDVALWLKDPADGAHLGD